MDIYTSVAQGRGAQSEQVDSKQVLNDAGGYTFTVSLADRVRRFVILGSDNGSFYASPRDLTVEGAKAVKLMAEEDHKGLVRIILEVSDGGLSKKQNALLFAYAIACSGPKGSEALAHFNRIIRTGTHLFMFLGYVQNFRGWGRALRRAVAAWYDEKSADALGYQMVKYRQREGWTHRDALRKAHPRSAEVQHQALYEWATAGEYSADLPPIVRAHLLAKESALPTESLAALIRNERLPWEAIPTDRLNDPVVLTALAEHMPVMATVRNLTRFGKAGLLPPMGGGLTDLVVGRLTDAEAIRKSRIHPMAILVALAAYDPTQFGAWGDQDDLRSPLVVSALGEAYNLSFGNVQPANRRTLVALDTSGSMTWESVAPGLTDAAVAAAMAHIQLATEPLVMVRAFDTEMQDIGARKGDSLQDIICKAQNAPAYGTDCAAPMLWAAKNRVEVDTFVIYTDSETWAGDVHPHVALQDYRRQMGIPAKLAVVATSANDVTIADPDDPGTLDVVGFSPDVPSVIADFSRG